jgi:hypothetical protein
MEDVEVVVAHNERVTLRVGDVFLKIDADQARSDIEAEGMAGRRGCAPAFDGDEITGVIDWSEAGRGDALYDLATLTLGHQEHLGDVVAGYGTDVDLDVIHAWWSWRSLAAVRWLVEHGFDPSPEIAMLRSQP